MTEPGAGGREFLIPYIELPANIAKAIAEAKPISSLARSISEEDSQSLSSLNSDVCRIVDMRQMPDSKGLDLGA